MGRGGGRRGGKGKREMWGGRGRGRCGGGGGGEEGDVGERWGRERVKIDVKIIKWYMWEVNTPVVQYMYLTLISSNCTGTLATL